MTEELVQEAKQDAIIEAVTFAEFVLGLLIVVIGFFVARFINVLAGALTVILGALVIAL